MPICTTCEASLPESSFYVRGDTGYLMKWCKKCHGSRNSENQKKRKEFQKELIDILKWVSGGQCRVCGETEGLEFNHIDPRTKLFQVTASGRSPRNIVKEWEKCELLCRSCHLRTTAEQRRLGVVRSGTIPHPRVLTGEYKKCRKCERELDKAEFTAKRATCKGCYNKYQKERRKDALEYIRSKKDKCVDCGSTRALEFDHVLPGKTAALAQLVSQTGKDHKKIDAELALCEVVCHVCHRKRTDLRRACGFTFETRNLDQSVTTMAHAEDVQPQKPHP